MNIIPASKIPGVYCITNTVNNKIYVGSSGSIYQRTARHKCDLLKNRHANSHLQSAVNKYGIDKFEISLIKIDDYYLS